MAIKRTSRRYPGAKIASLAHRLLNASPLCSIATVTPAGRAHINAAYFAWTPTYDIIWLSAREARHSRNLNRNRSVAIVVYDSHQTWGEPDRGLMLYGSARELAGKQARDAEDLYAKRFRAYDPNGSAGYRFYRMRPQRMKIFHERELGGGTFVTARNRAGKLTWLRTERYE
jgi:uncharacterized protein YhbP (UPF0306 family)